MNLIDLLVVLKAENLSIDENFDENDVLEETDNFGSVNLSFQREKRFHR